MSDIAGATQQQTPWYEQEYSDDTNWILNALRDGMETIQWERLLPPSYTSIDEMRPYIHYRSMMKLVYASAMAVCARRIHEVRDLGHRILTNECEYRFPEILDVCPDAATRKELLEQYILWTFEIYAHRDQPKPFNRTFLRLHGELSAANRCQRPQVRREFMEQVVTMWCAVEPRIRLAHLCAWYFDPYMVLEQCNTPDVYKQHANDLLLVLHDELVAYFTSPEGQWCWATIKRLRCGGFISQTMERVVDEFLMYKLGLPMVQFERPDMDVIMRRCGWVQFDDDEEHTVRTK